MSLKEFIFSKIFLKNLGLAVIIVVGVVMILLLWLNIYTRHGQQRAVPDFFGLNLEQTAALAKKSRMKFTVIDSVYTSLVNRGCIAEQNPKPGFKVKKWRNISLTINAFRPEMVAMPDLVNLPLRQVKAIIEGSGLVVGTKTFKPDLSVDVVLRQLCNGKEIKPYDSLLKGSVIDLVLGKGYTNQRAGVPNLIGMKLDDAIDRINVTSLNLGTCTLDNTIMTGEDSLNAFVYKQYPEYKEEATIPYGDLMYLWITIDTLKLPVDSTLIMVPDSAGTVPQVK